MPKYLFSYHGGGPIETPEQGEQIMAAWGAWMQGLGEALVDGGNPTGASMTMTKGGSENGGGANPVSGYSVLQADSMEHAMELGKSCPMLDAQNGSIEISEALDM
ncbi:MAG: hypothetical protein P8L68_14155 [Paracoccaceae bacterium]|nr:hypothetical protein [Paracoccaceae bacterium]MDG1737998.1 hypothetical protein [Paracoccaceae bacterium]MDG2259625.1 hypothetical protein [Paracoccaceae bacterium]